MRSTYKDDLADGKCEIRRPDSKMQESGTYTKGLKEGTWVYYDEKGTRSSWAEYKKGERVKSGTYKDEKK